MCVCVFQCDFNFGRDSFKMDNFLQSQHKNLFILHSFYFVCLTRFTQHFNIFWTTRKILLAVQIIKHLIVQTSPFFFHHTSQAKVRTFSGIILVCFYMQLQLEFSEQIFLSQDICEII